MMTTRITKGSPTDEIGSIRKRLELVSDDIQAVALGFGLSVFTELPWSANPGAALRAFDRYLGMCGQDGLGFYATETMSKHRKTTKATFSMLATWLKADAPARERISFELKGGKAAQDASASMFKIFGIEPNSKHYDPNDAAAIAMSFEFGATPAEVEKLFIEVCSSIALVSGHAGYRMNCSWYDAEESQTHAWRMGMRHWGADIPMLPEDAMAASLDGVKGVGWLTAIGVRVLNELGGLGGLRETLPPEVEMIQLPNGLILKAGAAPSIGDRNRGDTYQVERAIHRALAPAIERFIARAAPFDLESDEVECTDRWLRRFAHD
jgi:hypothetical protein